MPPPPETPDAASPTEDGPSLRRSGRRATTHDVARAAGVSQATVSNVLNHPERVSLARRESVTRAIAELGFVRHEAARQLRRGRSETLGLLLLDAWNPAFQDMARGVEETTDGAGWGLLMANSARTLDRQQNYLRLFAEARVAGMIVIPHDEYAEHLHQVRAGGAPVVVVDRAEDGADSLSVAVDDRAGGLLAAEHLLGLGHTHLLFVGDPSAAAPVHERLEGLREGLAGSGARLEVSDVEITVEGGRAAGRRLSPGPGVPTAVVAAIDAVAFGLLQALLSRGIRVPDDISVMGYDDATLTRHLLLPLTSVHRPHRQMGVRAAEILMTTIAGEEPAQRHAVFRPDLVVRSSTARPGGRS